jgi:hypothetical protein
MQVVFEKFDLPEAGVFEFDLHRTIDLRITAIQARRTVKRWLFDEVSMLISADEPTLVVGEQVAWRVPAYFSAPGVGRVGVVGTVDVDIKSGNIIDPAKCKLEIEREASKLASHLLPFTPFKVPPQYIPKHIPPASKLILPEE